MKTRSAILAFLVLGTLACGINSPGGGEKVGQIVRLSKHGFIRQTWEGEIIRGGFQGGSGTMGLPFDFTIESESMASRVKEFMDSQTEVVIYYRTEGIYSAFRSDSGGEFLVAIDPLEKN